ncbi:MAG: methionine adenosyltransferase [Candidatus Methylumidiphilus alinenensis]|uniref:Methionine adenosyltransferase n=1 Tax=Candidatus Methylumidiphilus alinenensis TaxID=2202197 RepID=A0A2W4RHB6_9GAMM|nr:MAG: methionine adenosyltransferase [Candidatus Methylumidiphilus alinenensis]
MKQDFLFTSEAVAEGHPDRLCDMISDTVVDRFLRQDPYSRVVTECALSKGVVFMAARFASTANVDLPDVARSVIGPVGYRPEDFNAADCTVVTSIITMSPDQRAKADELEMTDSEIEHLPATHQATIFGFACNQTPQLMPIPIMLANNFARKLTKVRRKAINYLSPDCTVQVGVVYENAKPVRIHNITIVAGYQFRVKVDPVILREDLLQHVINPVLAKETLEIDESTQIFINPQGAFPKSGPAYHSGMTGRKSAGDTYGGYARHNGAALSGKDPSRIDRTGVYAARYAAKNIVAAGLAEECEVQLSYCIGYSSPVSIQVQTFGTGIISDNEIKRRIEQNFDFRLGAIIRDFALRHLPSDYTDGFYGKLPALGHFANEQLDLPWERTDKCDLLK